jgi:nicotinamidase-related amidase
VPPSFAAFAKGGGLNFLKLQAIFPAAIFALLFEAGFILNPAHKATSPRKLLAGTPKKARDIKLLWSYFFTFNLAIGFAVRGLTRSPRRTTKNPHLIIHGSESAQLETPACEEDCLMPSKPHNRGNTQQSIALLIIDVINDMEFEEGKQLFKQALPMARKIAALKSHASAANVPIIYVNDNFGHWHSDLKKRISHCLIDGVRGEPIARLLVPDHSYYFVLKPKSSAFFATTLHTLLQYLGVRTLVLSGMAADVCILFTAHDAHLRDYEIIAPSECVVSNTLPETPSALANMKEAAHAVICKSADVHFKQHAGNLRPARARTQNLTKKS